MHHCTLEGLYGAIQAHHQIDQGPLFNKSNLMEAGLEAQISFAKVMNKYASKQIKGGINISEFNQDKSNLVSEAKGVLKRGADLGRTAEALVPKKVYQKIDKKMDQFATVYRKEFLPKFQKVEAKYSKLMEQAKRDKAKLKALEVKQQQEMAPIRKQAEKYYRDNLAKQFKLGKDQIQAAFDKNAGNPKKLEAKLKSMGLKQTDAYYTYKYLAPLENGGPFFNFSKSNNASLDWINERLSTITGKKTQFNPMTALYNASELAQKAPAVFGVKHTINGIKDALAAAKSAKVTIFDRIPQLEKEGVYSSDFSPLRPEGKYDPVFKTQNMLDNTAYFIGKRAGDIQKGLKEIAYRPKPWNDTFIYNDPTNKNLLNWMSFQFRHMQQYGGWVRDIYNNEGGRRGQSAKALATYALMSGVIFGDKAAIPAPLYYLAKGADPELDQQLEQFGPFKKGLVGAVTGGNVDLGKYAQPLGGVTIGLGADAVTNVQEAFTNTYPKAAKQVSEGRPDKAAVLAINLLTKFSQLFKNGANAPTQKAIDGVTKAYLDDEDFEGYFRDIGQKVFGKDAVPKKQKDGLDLNLDLDLKRN